MAEAEFPLTMETVWKTREGGPPVGTEKGCWEGPGSVEPGRNFTNKTQTLHLAYRGGAYTGIVPKGRGIPELDRLQK